MKKTTNKYPYGSHLVTISVQYGICLYGVFYKYSSKKCYVLFLLRNLSCNLPINLMRLTGLISMTILNHSLFNNLDLSLPYLSFKLSLVGITRLLSSN